jgi:hypothetical protein
MSKPAGGSILSVSQSFLIRRHYQARCEEERVLPTLAICGDLIVGQALTLLLRASGYDTTFVPATSLGEPWALKDVWLLVLTPTPELSIERRNALLASLKEATEAVERPVLMLVTPSEKGLEEEAWGKLWYRVSWPCSTSALAWQIESALLRHYEPQGKRLGDAANRR